MGVSGFPPASYYLDFSKQGIRAERALAQLRASSVFLAYYQGLVGTRACGVGAWFHVYRAGKS